MIAIDGPMQGKYYSDSVTANKIVENIMVDFVFYEVMYYRSNDGWRFHSWRKVS